MPSARAGGGSPRRGCLRSPRPSTHRAAARGRGRARTGAVSVRRGRLVTRVSTLGGARVGASMRSAALARIVVAAGVALLAACGDDVAPSGLDASFDGAILAVRSARISTASRRSRAAATTATTPTRPGGASCTWSACRAADEGPTVTGTCSGCDDDLDGHTDEGFACEQNALRTCLVTACGTPGSSFLHGHLHRSVGRAPRGGRVRQPLRRRCSGSRLRARAPGSSRSPASPRRPSDTVISSASGCSPPRPRHAAPSIAGASAARTIRARPPPRRPEPAAPTARPSSPRASVMHDATRHPPSVGRL